jgi:hypothetical protein
MPLSPDLLRAYEKADYLVYDDLQLVLRIGKPNPVLDSLLEADGAATAAFITPFNPHGLQRGEDDNWEAFVRFMDEVNATSHKIYAGEGRDPEGEWPHEPSLFIVSISRADAQSLGRRYGQLAIVFAEWGKAPELVLLAP